MTKVINKYCKCENCGNEADMELTCSYAEYEEAAAKASGPDTKEKQVEAKVKASSVCKNCGNEADMWIDVD